MPVQTQKIKKLLVIIGSAKAGTTALAHYLPTHPDLVLGTQKETRFFTHFAEKDWSGPRGNAFKASLIVGHDAYAENFAGLTEDQWAIDASTDYIWCEETPELMRRYAETCDVRVIAIVRDPIDRAVSEYNHTLRRNMEPLSFSASVDAEEERYQASWNPLFYHKRRSLVRDNIHRFHDVFGDHLMVLDYKDLKDISALMQRVCTFLDIPALEQAPVLEQKNINYLPRNRLAKTVAKSDTLKALGRRLLPRQVRKSVRGMLRTNARNIETVTPQERQGFQALLADEIAACVEDPLIPTDNWSCVRPSQDG